MTKNIKEWLEQDPYLRNYERVIQRRVERQEFMESYLTGNTETITDFAQGFKYFGLHLIDNSWCFREWAPAAKEIFLVGDMTDWREVKEYSFNRLINSEGVWKLNLPKDKLLHGQHFRLKVNWNGGSGERIPSYAKRVVQDTSSLIFTAQVWKPENIYKWKHPEYIRKNEPPLIYEAHIGMSQEKEGIGTYKEFIEKVIPHVVKLGYNTLQLMAIQEHPYYGSFGYQVANFFAPSFRYGTPEELKELIDTAHDNGLAVIMDLVHSHSVRNEIEGLALFDGTPFQYFHEGSRGDHVAWDSKCFDYGKHQVIHFLLSNCRFWLEEYKFDGFRFDGVTSMLYHDHGLGKSFTSYDDYFNGNVDEDALLYLQLANKVIHTLRPDAITIAEDVSGMPGMAMVQEKGGVGFDYRFAMGVPDYWIKLTKDIRDEDWNISELYRELTNRRCDEKTISYAESHDQALVGDKTLMFRLADADMYWHMQKDESNIKIDRAIALHKMIRLATFSTAGHGYMNFIGNEFGHPEWIDFPRVGNCWSYYYCRRQWSLLENPNLKYLELYNFEQEMIRIQNENKFLVDDKIRVLHENNDNKVIVYYRAGLIFAFNFSPNSSYDDYCITIPESGKYVTLLHTDSPSFGGFGRLTERHMHYSFKVYDENRLGFYLPSRTALILTKIN
jgi:1,4-alpha-glucan branching enzyme